uniref:Uncharacterized protein n=1 Tax=Candidatus Kentrum sp. TC TaxID=2126339 RepID=A0A450YV69_9GAMM|nr:MAG: hypothetical protein BECKTC1821E_GA0114239_10491 [Candidatus Kentron sp. TC]
MVREELFPVVLETPLESEIAFADGFHDGLNPTSIPDSARHQLLLPPRRGILFFCLNYAFSQNLTIIQPALGPRLNFRLKYPRKSPGKEEPKME